MKKTISVILIFLITVSPLGIAAAQTTSCSSSSIISLAQYSACCSGRSDDTAACKTFASRNGGSGAPANNNCSAVTSLSQYAACCDGSTTDSTACKSYSSSLQHTNATVSRYNPNVSITSGNTYGGISISGVGGAIASCANVGGFLVKSISGFLNDTFGVNTDSSASDYNTDENSVSTSDKTAQEKLDSMNRTTQCLNGVAYAVAKNTLAQVTNKTLNWVNTGLNGNPLYVQNIGSLLNSIKNQQLTNYLGTVQGSNPIFGNALRSVITYQATGKLDGLISSTLNTPQAQKYNSFMNDFTDGGWGAFLNPSYNPIGAFFDAADTVNNSIAMQQQNTQNEVQRNNGFLDLKHCTQYANNGQVSQTTTDTSLHKYSTSAGKSYYCKEDYAGELTSSLADCYDGNYPAAANSQEACVDFQNNKYDTLASSCATTNVVATDVSTQKGAGFTSQPVCTQWSTDTPGSIIANQVATITTSPTRQLEYADKINEVLGGFFDSLVNNLLSKGLRGSGTKSSNQSSIIATAGSEGDNSIPNATSGTGGDLSYQSTTNSQAISGDFDISRPQDLRAVIQTQYNYLSRAKDAQVSLDRVIPSIGALDYCIPGPNPAYKNGTDSNWSSFVSSIQQADVKSPSTAEKLISAIPEVGPLISGIVSLFTGSNSQPPIWNTSGLLADNVRGISIQVPREFYTPAHHSDGVTTDDVVNTLNLSYKTLMNQYAYYDSSQNTFADTPVGPAFQQANQGDGQVDGFLKDSYTLTYGLLAYNQTASTIKKDYAQNISDTTSDVEQLETIRKEVNSIVSKAKARYIAQRAAQGNPVNMQCINQAYQINNNPITGVARQEPNPKDAQEDAMVAHSSQAASTFYQTQIN